MVARGEIYWADLPAPHGSEAGFTRPVLVVQSDELNSSRIRTIVCVPLTSNLTWAQAPGNVLLDSRATSLPHDSVAQAPLIFAANRSRLTERVGRLDSGELQRVMRAIDIVLGRI